MCCGVRLWGEPRVNRGLPARACVLLLLADCCSGQRGGGQGEVRRLSCLSDASVARCEDVEVRTLRFWCMLGARCACVAWWLLACAVHRRVFVAEGLVCPPAEI